MENQNKSALKLMLFLLFILALWTINIYIPINGELSDYSYRLRQNYIWYIGITIFSACIIIKRRKIITYKDSVAGIILGALAGRGELLIGAGTCLAYISSVSIFYSYETKINLFKSPRCKRLYMYVIASVLIVIGIFSFIYKESRFIYIFLGALKPGISEEITFRMFLFAISLYFVEGELDNQITAFLCYIILILPHALMHYPDQAVMSGLGSILGNTILLSVMYGIPLTLLLLKHDLFTAMTIHFLIDYISFSG